MLVQWPSGCHVISFSVSHSFIVSADPLLVLIHYLANSQPTCTNCMNCATLVEFLLHTSVTTNHEYH